MVKEFKSLKSFATHIRKQAEKFPIYEKKVSLFVGEILEKEAKDKIGHLHDAAGTFAAWEPLAESTKKDKERNDYVFNHEYNPLYRTGEAKESISHSYVPEMRKILLGSPSQILAWQEEGTRYIPPRSSIGATLFQSGQVIKYAFSGMLRDWAASHPIKVRISHYGSI